MYLIGLLKIGKQRGIVAMRRCNLTGRRGFALRRYASQQPRAGPG